MSAPFVTSYGKDLLVSILSAQSIRRLSQGDRPLIAPFVERGVVGGRSYGLSACSYDCRIAQDLDLFPGEAALASTMERFVLPDNLCGSVMDKSTYARVFMSVFNTHLDPGWEGWLTVELVNHGEHRIKFEAGTPLCQVKFEWLDRPTILPYRGKYSDQPNEPVPAKLEGIVG
jgi:dCTP deaminase